MHKAIKIAIVSLMFGAFAFYIALAIMHAIDAEEQINERNRTLHLEHLGRSEQNAEHSYRVAAMIMGGK